MEQDRTDAVPWIPLPTPQQVWEHSCCSKEQLEAALRRPGMTAIEADVLMGVLRHSPGPQPCKIAIMAHPPSTTSDLSFQCFLDRLVQDARHHLKLDFKDLQSLQLCLPQVAAVKVVLNNQGQVVWINADILPGPNRRRQSCPIPAASFFAAVRQHCPGIALSLGWRVSRAWGDAYTNDDISSMLAACSDCKANQGLVFAVNARLALRNPEPLLDLLAAKPKSQLLLWTGTGEPPIPSWTRSQLGKSFKECEDRVGYDCQVASSCFHGLICQLLEGCLATLQYAAGIIDLA